jgi:hypothetical protein
VTLTPQRFTRKQETVEAVQVTEPGTHEHHTVCCYDDAGVRAFCGIDVTDLPWEDLDAATCVVCADLEKGDYCPAYGVCRDVLAERGEGS